MKKFLLGLSAVALVAMTGQASAFFFPDRVPIYIEDDTNFQTPIGNSHFQFVADDQTTSTDQDDNDDAAAASDDDQNTGNSATDAQEQNDQANQDDSDNDDDDSD